MTRTTTDPGSVFSPVSASSAPPPTPQTLPQQGQRGRSNTLPSPYEVPDTNNGSGPIGILPDNSRTNSAHNSLQHRINPGGATAIPPPPTHSPPPYMHSSSDVASEESQFHHHTHHRQQSDGRQNTLPRALPNQRSLSTSAAQGRSVGVKTLGYMKSDGNIHEPRGNEDMVYIQPPIDSDLEPSIVSASSYGQGSDGGSAPPTGHQRSVERGRAPPYHHAHHHTHHQQPRARHPGMINGALASSDQFANFGGMGGDIPPSFPLSPGTNPMGERDKTNVSRGRESLFSETSTELSVSSSSEKEYSPGKDSVLVAFAYKGH